MPLLLETDMVPHLVLTAVDGSARYALTLRTPFDTQADGHYAEYRWDTPPPDQADGGMLRVTLNAGVLLKRATPRSAGGCWKPRSRESTRSLRASFSKRMACSSSTPVISTARRMAEDKAGFVKRIEEHPYMSATALFAGIWYLFSGSPPIDVAPVLRRVRVGVRPLPSRASDVVRRTHSASGDRVRHTDGGHCNRAATFDDCCTRR